MTGWLAGWLAGKQAVGRPVRQAFGRHIPLGVGGGGGGDGSSSSVSQPG